MDYQLVLQLRGDSAEGLEFLIELEERLAGSLGPMAEIDGHDIGSGEANIFIRANDPVATFETLKPVLAQAELLSEVTAAFREGSDSRYTILWPSQSKTTFRIA